MIDFIAKDVMDSIYNRPAILEAQCQVSRARVWILILRILGCTVILFTVAAAGWHFKHKQEHRIDPGELVHAKPESGIGN
jgi:acyl-CoA synthetase (AMP-forming)/AMP-acid ligase II